MVVIISSHKTKSRFWSWDLMLDDGIYREYYRLPSIRASSAISQRDIAQIPSHKLPDAEYKPYQVRNPYRSSTQPARHAKTPKRFQCRATHLRPKDVQNPRHNAHPKHPIHQKIPRIRTRNRPAPLRPEIHQIPMHRPNRRPPHPQNQPTHPHKQSRKTKNPNQPTKRTGKLTKHS